ncbi:MAG: cupin domain-containing protein [Alphaproteobacteria bacterium]|nr:cupin domain-containing protein [Alphaproteobacteria bacterium]
MSQGEIFHRDALPSYCPPGHSATVNRRLVEASFGGGFEMIHGRLAPGGEAERHHHKTERQVIYVVSGQALIALGDQPAKPHGPGTVARIPPGIDHWVKAVGTETLELIVVYSPPLAKP